MCYIFCNYILYTEKNTSGVHLVVRDNIILDKKFVPYDHVSDGVGYKTINTNLNEK